MRKAGKLNNAFFLFSCIPYCLRLRLLLHGFFIYYLNRLEYGLSSFTHHSSLFHSSLFLMSSAHGVRWVNQYGFISFPRPWDRSHSLAWKPTAKESAAWNFAGWRPSPCGRSSPGRSSTAKADCTRPLPITSRPTPQNPPPHFSPLLAKPDPVANTARDCKGLPHLLLERPRAVMWPNRGGGPALAI